MEMSGSPVPPPYRPERPLRILTLDGGGIRGLASLYLLQDLMLRIQVKEHLKDPPQPFQWFDLIVGTSTGGLIALMLGRLKMSVNDAIEAYRALVKEIFETDTRAWVQRLNPVASTPKYSADKLQVAFHKIAKDERLADPDPVPTCRVAVVAVQERDADRIPDLLRTYTTDELPYECTIVDAARATSAATTFFPPAKVQVRRNLQITYLDGALGNNNPARLAVEEAEEIWGYRSIGCIVSIGTGIPHNVRFSGNQLTLAKQLQAVATGCKAVHISMDRCFGGMKKRMYFRFDPPTDLASIGLDEWQKLDEIGELAYSYVQGDKVKLKDCVTAITAPPSLGSYITLAPSAPPLSRPQQPVRILALDGGGIRGLASLFVLQDLMERLQVQEKLKKVPRPCEWFDLIVGTSTGGLIALMLGRLKLSVDEAIDAYEHLAETVFGEETRSWMDMANPVSSAARYSADKLRSAIGEIAGDALLEDPPTERKSRVAVVAVREVDVAGGAELLRTYTTDVPPYRCTIVDAARATSAATTFFPPASVQIKHGLKVTYLDGGLRYNNPARLAVEEAEQIWGYGTIGCIVSIGTGISPAVHFEGNKLILANKLLNILTGCKAVHQNMEKSFGGMEKRAYFRFDPPTDLGSIGLDEWQKLKLVSNVTHNYVQSDQVKLGDCVYAIRNPTVLAAPY